jgi:hypothetical protein
MGKYLDIAKKLEAAHAAEGSGSSLRVPSPSFQDLTAKSESCPIADYIEREERLGLQESPLWPCPHCGHPATIDDVCPSLDNERTLTLWRCDPCGVISVTPDTIRTPPTVWVRTIKQ